LALTRVYILAKELGVKSSAIVQKCQDEGLDVKNHMAVISAGLAATIREWFTEGENVTTVETAEKVDLQKVRIRKKVKKEVQEKKEEEAETAQAGPGLAVAEVVEQQAGVPPAVELPPAAEDLVEAAKEQVPAEVAAVAAPEKAPVAAPVVEKIEKKEEEKPVVKEPIVPAGPMLERPAPAKLTGPQVVRIEEPEPLPPPRRGRPKHELPITEPLMGVDRDEDETGSARPKDKKRPAKHHKERTHGRRRDELDAAGVKKAKPPGRWRQIDIDERQARLSAAGGEGLRLRPVRKIATKAQREAAKPARPQKVVVAEPVTVRELATAIGVKFSDIITKLMQQGVMATANQVISKDVAELIAIEFDTELVVERKATLEEQIRAEFEKRPTENLKRRPVVAAMLGHVDHGKTSLLDRIRSTQVAAGEAGGITQHIGASQITWDRKTVTFLDTPGHEAFTAMRARGANMTDVVVLVVAANDGVMPQTVEAISHCKAAKVSVVVALNKIDLPGCDINRIYSQLAEHGLVAAEWGGDTEIVKTSAVTGDGIKELLEHLDLMGDLLELKADDTIPATGWVVEAKLSPQRGPVATLLLKEGCLKVGDIVLAGTAYGRVKQLKDSFGKMVDCATSSMPVEIAGLSNVPQAGERFYCLDDINKAKAAAEESQMRSRESSLVERTRVTLDNLFSQIEAGKTETLNVIIRADVQGSVDVLKEYISEMSAENVKISILHAATGGITEGDVVLAEASNAIIIGFNVVPEEQAAKRAEVNGVEIRLYNIIYRITEDIQKSMAGLLEPEEQEKTLGRAVVRATFKVSRIGTVAGCYVTSGLVNKNAKVRLIRDNIVIKGDLGIETLKHFKDDVREVKAGLECGIKIARFDDIKIDDVFEFYEIVKVARTLA
jgi:translation initiation factor IF-2